MLSVTPIRVGLLNTKACGHLSPAKFFILIAVEGYFIDPVETSAE